MYVCIGDLGGEILLKSPRIGKCSARGVCVCGCVSACVDAVVGSVLAQLFQNSLFLFV